MCGTGGANLQSQQHSRPTGIFTTDNGKDTSDRTDVKAFKRHAFFEYMENFKPTWLMIKRHSVTGMKYFCKTIPRPESKMLSYKGSGKVWLKHIKKHGKQHVVTDWFQLFVDQNECTQFAIKFSKDNNIVLSNE